MAAEVGGHGVGQPGEGVASGAAGGFDDGQRTTGGTTAHTDEAMLLILGDDGLDVGQLPDLVPQRFRIRTAERLTARMF